MQVLTGVTIGRTAAKQCRHWLVCFVDSVHLWTLSAVTGITLHPTGASSEKQTDDCAESQQLYDIQEGTGRMQHSLRS